MSASSIFFNGRLISIPGSFTEVDASGLESSGLASSGIVALIGMSIGGKPWNAVDEGDVKANLQVATKASQPRAFFRSGSLREGADMVFGPGKDQDIPAGAQEVVFLKANPSTKSTATFSNALGAALVLSSADYGYPTTQVSVAIAAGTNKGKLFTVTFETLEEVFDDIGGDTVFTLTYLSGTPADGFTTITAAITASRLRTLFTRAQIGLDTEVTNQVTATQVIEMVSSSALDTAVVIRIFGTDTSNLQQTEDVTLTGTTAIDTGSTWNSYHGAEVVSGVLVGTCTIRNDAAGTTISSIAPGGTEAAIEFMVDTPVTDSIYVAADGASTAKVTIIGLSAAGLAQRELLTLAGAVPVASGTSATSANCTFTNGSVTVATAADLTAELTAGDFIYLTADTITAAVQISSLTASAITLVTAYAGAGGAAGASTRWRKTIKWSRIDGLALGELAAARTVTVTGTSVDANFAGLETIQKLADKFNGSAGYTMSVSISNPSVYPSADLDHATATNIKSAALMTATGNLAAIIAKLNAESQLVTAAKGAVASGAPSNVTTTFLAGGHEGSAIAGQEGVPTATSADWQGCFDLLKKVRVNTIVPITGDAAIHAQGVAHCEYMAGAGRNERDMVVGALNAALTDVPTKAEYIAAGLALNTRHVRVCGQAIERFSTLNVRQEFLPPYQACVVAGMQAGSAVGTSLSHKFANVLKLRQSTTWNPADDSEALIQAGLLMMEVVDNIGRRVVRNVTTHLTSSNLAYTEASVNEAVNYSVYNFRTEMETMVGRAGFAGTANAAKGLAVNRLGLLVGVSIVAWRSLDITLILDVLETAVEIAPVLPVNFVKSTIHLVAIPQSAAA